MRKIVPVFNTPLKVKENDPARRELENLVTEGINSTTKESRFIVEDVEEFENGVGKRTSPLMQRRSLCPSPDPSTTGPTPKALAP